MKPLILKIYHLQERYPSVFMQVGNSLKIYVSRNTKHANIHSLNCITKSLHQQKLTLRHFIASNNERKYH